jgi:hypothetical protein
MPHEQHAKLRIFSIQKSNNWRRRKPFYQLKQNPMVLNVEGNLTVRDLK